VLFSSSVSGDEGHHNNNGGGGGGDGSGGDGDVLFSFTVSLHRRLTMVLQSKHHCIKGIWWFSNFVSDEIWLHCPLLYLGIKFATR